MEPTIRLAEPGDAEAIRAIYNLEVLESTVTFDLVPRTLEEQLAWLAEHSGGHPAIVAVDGAPAPAVMGFGSLSPYRRGPRTRRRSRTRCTSTGTAAGEGIGRALLAELVRLARRYGFHSMIARIVGGHEASIALHGRAASSSSASSARSGRKFGRWLDVVLMQRML